MIRNSLIVAGAVTALAAIALLSTLKPIDAPRCETIGKVIIIGCRR